jgi:hypothetical protein
MIYAVCAWRNIDKLNSLLVQSHQMKVACDGRQWCFEVLKFQEAD